jgi:hypothetical protein
MWYQKRTTNSDRVQKRKICFVRHGLYPRDRRSRKQTDALIEAGYHVDVICLKGETEALREDIDAVRVYRIPITHRRTTVWRYFFQYGLSFLLFSILLAFLHLRRRYRCIPVERGGQDGIAEVMARMHGWEVRSFRDIEVLHHRRTGLEIGHILLVYFREGIKEYSNGYHPLFEAARCLVRILERPVVLGSIFQMSGFFWACLRREPRLVPHNVVTYLRREQLQRLVAVCLERKPI